jgi:hypothetical protein
MLFEETVPVLAEKARAGAGPASKRCGACRGAACVGALLGAGAEEARVGGGLRVEEGDLLSAGNSSRRRRLQVLWPQRASPASFSPPVTLREAVGGRGERWRERRLGENDVRGG